jgi:hypothetical protein
VDLPCSVDYLGGSGCELVAFRYAPAYSSELVEPSSLILHLPSKQATSETRNNS